MIGFHMQRSENDWTRAAAKLPAGAVFLSVDDLHLCRDAKQANGGLITVFRKHVGGQHPSSNQEANRNLARQYFASFIDGTFWQQELWRYIDIYKEWNEYPMDSNHFSWLQAVCWVWQNEYQLRYPDQLGGKPLACISRPIGNDIPLEFAQVVAQYDNVMSYHNYTPVRGKVIYPGEWENFSGRWTVNDARYPHLGLRWIFTEGGPILHPGDGHPLPDDGWLHHDCLNGDVEAYKAVLSYQIDRISQWNATHGNRAIGGVLFTSGHVGWDLFQVDQPEMDAFADHIRTYIPAAPPPDPQPLPTGGWQAEIWQASVNEQMARGIPLNPNAGLQQMITNHPGDYTPVHRERTVTTADGRHRGFMAGESITGQGPRKVWSFILPWSGPGGVTVFTDPN